MATLKLSKAHDNFIPNVIMIALRFDKPKHEQRIRNARSVSSVTHFDGSLQNINLGYGKG